MVYLNEYTLLFIIATTDKVEATESDFADVLQEVKPVDLPKFFHGLGLHYGTGAKDEAHTDHHGLHHGGFGKTADTFDAVDLLRKWKDGCDGGTATRATLMRALKKCNAEAKKNIEWRWRGRTYH